MPRLFWLAAGLAMLVSAQAHAQGLTAAGWGLVAEVTDGDTLVLEQGLIVRLVGIQAPKLPLGRDGFEQQPLAPEAKAALQRLTLGKRVRLSYGGLEADRYGRALAHLYTDDGLWIQGEMLRLGLARVYSLRTIERWYGNCLGLRQWPGLPTGAFGHWRISPFARPKTPAIISTVSRWSRAGFWRQSKWAAEFILISAPIGARISRFQWRHATPACSKRRGLTCFRFRDNVRGWLRNFNGPVIDVTHPEQLESLGL